MPKDLSAEFGSLKEDIDAEIEKLKTEGETLAKSISDQGVLYNTFQRIREKVQFHCRHIVRDLAA